MPGSDGASVVTWVYCEDWGVEGMYPQVGGNPADSRFHAVYWRCAAISMLSAASAFPDAKRLLYTNLSAPPRVDGIDLAEVFGHLGVEVRQVLLTRSLGPDTPWRNQFYVFDVLEDVCRTVGDEHVVIVLDGDCIWTGSGELLVQDVADNGAVTYRIDYPQGVLINGISLEIAIPVRKSVGLAPSSDEVGYYGGELIAVTGRVARQAVGLFVNMWDENLTRKREGQPYLTEEAHVLSAIYDHLGVSNDIGNRYIKRMWTSLRCNTISANDETLLLWHLPAEKEYAFRDVFRAAARRGLFKPSSIGNAEVTRMITETFRKSWQAGPTRVRHDARRIVAALKRRLT